MNGRIRRSQFNNVREGFTILELLVAMAVITALSAIAVPTYRTAIDHANVTRAIGDIGALQTEILSFEAAGKGLPASLAEIGRGTLLDPWGAPYQYLRFETGNGRAPPSGARKDRFLVPINSSFDLYSRGKDGGSASSLRAAASRDDIVRANDGGFIGLAVMF